LRELAHDSYRFAMTNCTMIEQAPFQVYNSALIFSPSHSRVRELFRPYETNFIDPKPRVEEDWGPLLQTLEGHTDYVMSVAFSPLGDKIASGSSHGIVRVWDAITGALLYELRASDGWITTVVFSPDNGDRILAGVNDKSIHIWESATGALLHVLEENYHQGEPSWFHKVAFVAFSPRGDRILSCSRDQAVRIWNAKTANLIKTIEGLKPTEATFSADEDRLAIGSEDGSLWIWDALSDALLQTYERHERAVKKVIFSPNERKILSTSGEITIRIRDILKVWDSLTGVLLHTLNVHGFIVGFSPMVDRIISCPHDSTVEILDVKTGVRQMKLEGHTSFVYSAAFSPSGTKVVSSSGDTTIRIWDTELGTLPTPKARTTGVSSIAFSPTGHKVVSGSVSVNIWDTTTGALLHTLAGHRVYVWTVSFSPSGDRIVSSSHDLTARVWDAKAGRLLQTLRHWEAFDQSFAFSPSESEVVAFGAGKSVKVWDIASGKQVKTPAGHFNSVGSLAYSMKSPVSTLNVDGRWVTCKGERILLLPKDRQMVKMAVYGNMLAIGSPSGSVTILHCNL
jgi:WD40 repeat protein